MSILIKGMKMPEKCGSCDLFHVESPMHCTVVKGHKTVGAPYGMPRPDWCPLVEIPEHGRLIDGKAPEIIRCGECRHRDPEDKKCDCAHDIIWQLARDDNWYCADAERRTDG